MVWQALAAQAAGSLLGGSGGGGGGLGLGFSKSSSSSATANSGNGAFNIAAGAFAPPDYPSSLLNGGVLGLSNQDLALLAVGGFLIYKKIKGKK